MRSYAQCKIVHYFPPYCRHLGLLDVSIVQKQQNGSVIQNFTVTSKFRSVIEVKIWQQGKLLAVQAKRYNCYTTVVRCDIEWK